MKNKMLDEEVSTDNADEIMALRQVKKLKGFYSHLARYIIIVLVLWIINLLTSPHYLWAIWVTLGWGIGVFFHALSIFCPFNFLGPEWEKKQVEKILSRKEHK